MARNQANGMVRSVLAVAMVAGMCVPAFAIELAVKADAPDALIVDEAPRTVTVSVTGKTPADDDAQYELRQQFVNRYNEVTDGPTLEVSLDGDWQQRVEVPVEFFGPATYRATLVKVGEDQPVAQVEQMLIRPVPVPRLSEEERADSPIGVNTHAGAHWETLAAMGIHWARDYSWGWLGHAETAPRASNGVEFKPVVEAAREAGVTILPIMQQAFRTPDKKFFIADTEVIASAYEKLSNVFPGIHYWELDNEADLVHRDVTSDDFKKWFQSYLVYIPAADRGLDAAGHGAEVVLNGEAGIHPERTQEMIDKVGEHFTVVNYHQYTGTVAPELAIHDTNTGAEKRPQSLPFLDRMRELNRIAHAAGKEAWLTEIGWSARRGPAVGDRLQSAYLQRIYLLAEWAGTDKTFWFWDRDLPGEGRFSSTGLIVQDEEAKGNMQRGALPAGAAMAGVSKFIAQADYLGSIDLGADRWCLVFERPEGGYTVAAWSVESEYDLPPQLTEAPEAFGMYGNPLRDRRLTAEPAYFQLASLPDGWEPQLDVEWLSPRIINIHQGGGSELEASLPGDANVTWQDLPAAAEAGDWSDGRAALRATPELAPGEYAVTATVEGDGWRKRFPLTLKVRPAIAVAAEPYAASEPAAVELTNMMPDEVTVDLASDAGTAQPATLTLAPGATGKSQFTPASGTQGPATLTLTLSNGGTQQATVRPRHLDAPRAGSITLDGDLSDWPEGGTLTPAFLKVEGPAEQFAPTIRLAWSPEGLYVAGEIPVGEGFESPAAPDAFWEWTGLEMNMHAADARAAAAAKPSQRHLLWFTPVKAEDGNWRVYAGEWQKVMPDGEKQTLKDDQRMRTAAQYDGETVTIEALIPVEVLGVTPEAGAVWPLTINAKLAEALSPRTVASWPAGSGGTAGWGRVHLAE